MTNTFEPRFFDPEGKIFGERSFNDMTKKPIQSNNQLNNTKSWFEHLMNQTMKQNEQLRLNTSNNRQAKYALHDHETFANVQLLPVNSW